MQALKCEGERSTVDLKPMETLKIVQMGIYASTKMSTKKKKKKRRRRRKLKQKRIIIKRVQFQFGHLPKCISLQQDTMVCVRQNRFILLKKDDHMFDGHVYDLSA